MKRESTILFVDDEQFILEALSRVFRNEEYRVLCAESGQEALILLNNEQVQVIVSDFRMPKMSGGELLRAVAEKWPETVRIILSGYADVTSVVSAINDGQIYKFLSKPWDHDELLGVVRAGVERYWQQFDLRSFAEATAEENFAILAKFLNDESGDGASMLPDAGSKQVLQIYKDVFDCLLGPMLLFREDELVDANSQVFEALKLPVGRPLTLANEPLVQALRRHIGRLSLQNGITRAKCDVESHDGATLSADLAVYVGASSEVIAVAKLGEREKALADAV